MSRSIFVVGAGAAGGSLAVALARAGRAVIGVFDLSGDRAEAIGRTAGITAHGGAPPAAIKQAEVVLVAVSDSAIRTLASQAAEQGVYESSQIWLHVSGALPASELGPLEGRVRAIGAFHPAHVFAPGKVTEITEGVCFAVDGDDLVREVTAELASDLGGRVVPVPASARPLYHATTVLASNCLVALVAEARQALASAGIPEDEAESLLTCLAASATDRAMSAGLDASLSGPIRRGDADTIERHLKALGKTEDAERIYRLLGQATMRLARRIGETDTAALEQISALLREKNDV